MTPAERVARGVAFLDRTQPGWWDRINLLTFDIRRPCACVLGQVFAPADDYGWEDEGWEQGCSLLWHEAPPGYTQRRSLVEEHGFDRLNFDGDLKAGDADYRALQAEWSRIIAERQAVTP